MNRKRAILGALLGILAVCLIYAYLATPHLEKAPPRAAVSRQQPVNQKFSEEDQKEPRGRIDFAYLSSTPQEFAGAQRDIFRFGQLRPVKTVPNPPVIRKEVPKPVVMPEVVPVAVMQQSLSQFTFLGFLEKAGAKTVFLSSGGNLYLVNQGERFGARQEFLVVQIDDNLLKVRHDGREGLIEVELIEKQKLNAAVSAPVSVSRNTGPAMSNEKTRVSRPSRRIARPVVRPSDQDFQGDAQQEDLDFQGDVQQEDLDFQGDVQQEDLDFQGDVQQEDQGFQGDDNSWPSTER